MVLSTKKRGNIYTIGLKEKPYIYESSDKVEENKNFLLYKVFKGNFCTYAIWDKKKEENIFYIATLLDSKKEFKKLSL